MDKEHFKKIKNLAENQEALKYFNTTYEIDPKNLGIKNYKEYEDKLEETIKRYRARKEYENKLEETIKRYRSHEFKLTKKNYLIIALSAIAIALVVGLYPFLLIGSGVIDITGLSGPNLSMARRLYSQRRMSSTRMSQPGSTVSGITKSPFFASSGWATSPVITPAAISSSRRLAPFPENSRGPSVSLFTVAPTTPARMKQIKACRP